LERWISGKISDKTRRQALHRFTDELNDAFSGRPTAEPARRVSPATAARRLCSAQPGHDAPGRAFITPASARVAPRSIFASPRPPSSPQQQPSASSLRHRHSQLQLALSRPVATATASPSSLQLPASPSAVVQALVSRRAVHSIAGAPPLAPSPWPRRHRPPQAAIER